MADYLLLIPNDEAEWEAMSEPEHQVVFGQHREFQAALAARGHAVVEGAELARSSTALTMRRGPDGPVVTDGPFAESTEQVSGFYLIRTDDRDDLVACLEILSSAEPVLELRECLRGS
jgi:hypothetical protein